MINKVDLKLIVEKFAELENINSKISDMKKEFEEQLSPLKKAKEFVAGEISDLKMVIEIEALAHFEKTKEKNQLGGIKVQETSSSEVIFETKKAVEFCKEKDMFMILDKKAFSKAAESLNLDFVEIKTTFGKRVTFPKKINLED